MEKKLASRPHIAKAFIPNFAVGCRRLTPGPGYLEALCEDHVDFISAQIDRITETGIRCADGSHKEYDTIVCATGFDTTYRPRIPVIGRNGTNLQDLWDAPAPPHYMSIAAGPDHPNFVSLVSLRASGHSRRPRRSPRGDIVDASESLTDSIDRAQFIVNGPNSALGSGSLLVLFEREVDYIVSCIGKMLRENYRTMAVKQGAVDGERWPHERSLVMSLVGAVLTRSEMLLDWMDLVGAYFPTTVFGTKCRSWYKKGLEGAALLLFPFPFPRQREILTS